jgi:hypothetical protein
MRTLGDSQAVKISTTYLVAVFVLFITDKSVEVSGGQVNSWVARRELKTYF